MAKRRRGGRGGGRGNIIGMLGGVLIGAAILLFVCTLVLNNLKAANASASDSASFNTTIDQIKTMLTVCAVLMGVLGIVIVGAHIIAYIGGGM